MLWGISYTLITSVLSLNLKCPAELGYCVKRNGGDQNSGVKKLNSLDGNTAERQEDCLEKCLAIPGVTGCEVIWNQSNRGCYAHTQEVARGNGVDRHLCWIASRCSKPRLECPVETGFCVKNNGGDQNSGVIKLNSLDGNSAERQEDCLGKCLTIPGVTGCEVIWNQSNRGCYAHTKEVARGNGVNRHLCWIASRCYEPPKCPVEAGFCVTSNGGDQNSGVKKLNSLDGNTSERQEDCLKKCLAIPGATGCEVIWDQGNRGCYAHTKEVARGNGVDRHLCWIASKCYKPTAGCPVEAGFCVKSNGADQNTGVIKINSLDGNTSERQEDCLKMCLSISGATGCEVIWDQGNRGCYVHTKEVASGNGVDRHLCWIASKCNKPTPVCPVETGFCVKSNGADQNSGVMKLNSLDGNTSERQEDCLKMCLATSRATGCEVIWDQGNRGCYVHTDEVTRGNGVDRHLCWITSKCYEPTQVCPVEAGFCVKSNGSDQNSGVMKLNSLDGNTSERQEDCLKKCLTIPGTTGCEVIWDQGNRGCYAHTEEVARGNGRERHLCWIASKCKH